MKKALVLYPHQLFRADILPEVDTVFMVEDPLFFGRDQERTLNIHKLKVILHRASMRRYVEEVLWPKGLQVEYIEMDPLFQSGDILERAGGAEKLYIFDPIDELLASRLLQARRGNPKAPEITFLANPNFYLKDHEVRQYFAERHKHPFDEFYQWQRERFNVLIGADYKPIGGKWILDKSSAQPLPSGQVPPTFPVFGANKFVSDATKYVEKHFADNRGGTDFIWPTNHEEAAQWLQDFVDNRLDGFAPYFETLDSQAAWLYHSALSSCLNIGLLSPQQVVEAALKRHAKRPVVLESLESFIRQIIGQREYARGLYLAKHNDMKLNNPFKHQRKLTPAWYEGTTGLPPFDDLARKLQRHAYAHQSERAFIAAGLMIMCEIHPDIIKRWFSEMFIDAYEWSLSPNLYQLMQFAEKDQAIKPAVAASNMLLQMSNYSRGEWADVWDGLFWRFVDKHKDALQHNPAMRTMIQRLGRLDADRRRIINYRAEDFLNTTTLL